MTSRFKLAKIAWLMLMLVLTSVPATQALAEPFVTTERGFTTGTNEHITSLRQAGPLTIVEATYVDQLTGFLIGPAPGAFQQISNSRTGTAVFHGTEVCTCTTTDGRSGTITLFFEGTTAADGSSIGRLIFFRGTGRLNGLSGEATFKGDINSPNLPYVGTFIVTHDAPAQRR